MTFWALFLKAAGRFRITKNTGHKLTVDDLNTETPSVDNDKARVLPSDKRPDEASLRKIDPSQTSRKESSSLLDNSCCNPQSEFE